MFFGISFFMVRKRVRWTKGQGEGSYDVNQEIHI